MQFTLDHAPDWKTPNFLEAIAFLPGRDSTQAGWWSGRRRGAAIAKFCNDAELPLIMEGVETQEEFEAMGILGIHLFQGFFFAEPVKLPGAEKVLFPETGITQEKASL